MKLRRLAGMIGVLLLVGSFTAVAQQPINNAQVSGTAISTGNGTAGAGVQRVAIASDNTAFSVNASEAGTWSVRIQDTAGNGITSNSTTTTSKFAADVNVLSILGTAPTTAGKLDVKGADGDVFVRQATASNLKATVDLLGNAGAIMDFAGQNAAQPANSLLIGGEFNTSPTTITTGNASPLQLDSSGKLLVNCTGCSAGSTVSLVPATSGGLTISHTVSAGSTNATSTKASAGQVYRACLNSNAGYPTFLKLYNKASAPTVGTDTPVLVIEAQAGKPECSYGTEEGFAFGTGIAWAITKGIADSDSTAVLANDASVELAYK